MEARRLGLSERLSIDVPLRVPLRKVTKLYFKIVIDNNNGLS